ncbi:hypothetical protein A9Q83_07225 [Alphaproteobacteria bacterium 46_93_T64]|nr:hypothetical protein A9Q83_07225 [Alphaproteobacteria bacterium 46_93_T64]
MEIEYFFASYSAYAYLGAAELAAITKRTGAKVIYKPVDLRAVMPAAGSQSFAERSQFHKDYFFGREMVRWAEHRDLPIMNGIPTYHGNDITLSNCLLIAADKAGLDMEKLTGEMMRAHWVDDADLASATDLKKICAAVEIDAKPLFDTANDPDIVNTYKEYTDDAIKRGVFGSPTYFVADDMFYGQDRLELVERALHKPYNGKWPIR